MDKKEFKNNQIYVGITALFMSFAVIANINYFISGKDLYAKSKMGSNAIIYAQEFSNTEDIDIRASNPNNPTLVNKTVNYDTKVSQIRSYLSKKNSPLAEYAEEFVKASDEYGIDYRLVAAISIIESGGGKHCFRPYNAWGWGKSGFDSFKDGIWQVSKGLSKYYADGLDLPKEIAYRYCPPNAVKWGNNVSYVMSVISNQ
jgi:hypothetical protein